MMGADGNNDPLATTNINQHGARDAFGYSLSYFEDDYNSANTSMSNHSKGANPNLAADIYNGNIGSMFTALSDQNESAIGTHQTKYTYDQLNRIKSMQGFDRTVGAPESGSNYIAEYGYDENGNLTNLLRLAGSSGVIDKLSYVYDDPVNGGFNNRLTQVQDDEGQVVSVDLDDQSENNYEYDEIGQLIKDDAEKILSIKWTVNNKVDFIEYQQGEAIETIQFEYGAMGNRISKRVYSALSDSVITTYYVLDAQGNPMSKYKLYGNVGSSSDDNLYLSERNIYGSERVGMEKIGEIIASSAASNVNINTDVAMITGDKFFEMSNHLGNVLQVVTDNKLPEPDGQNGVDQYVADVVSYSDFYPFGMQMPGRNHQTDAYRYGFNGMESDDEVKGEGNSYTTEFRQYDPRVGRWLSVDPLKDEFPWQSPYVAMDNNPILLVDPYGDSTFVKQLDNGTYEVVGGNLEGDDKGIYLKLDGKLTGERLGESLTTHSFVDGNDEFVVGAIIDPEDKSGQEFIDEEIIGEAPSILLYVLETGRHQGKHDFKTRGENKDWSSEKKNQHRYRGSVTKDGKIGSARDFGNMGAGIMAGKHGMNWGETRSVFDGYQGGQEPLVSVKAQEIGWMIGRKMYINKNRTIYEEYKSGSLKYERE